MSTVSVRYLVEDVAAAVDFYVSRLGFFVQMQANDAFVMLSRGDLRLVLVKPAERGAAGGGGAPMPDGTMQQPGGWNRFSLEVPDLETTVSELRAQGARFRNDIVTGVGGKQVIVEDPSGNPIELFQPMVAEAWLARPGSGADERYEVRPIGHVASTLTDVEQAPNQGDAGAPDAWLVIDPAVREGVRDIRPGAEVLVLTWLHKARRDELTTHPEDDMSQPELGVFSTRSPARPNPIGLHRVSVLEVDGDRLRVGPLEAVDGTPIIDIKPVITPGER
jgi:tRNA-Thr(GGU) m(6)t(6)A37 methyltransferase TsaA